MMTSKMTTQDRLIFLCGSGGVGKTTLSSALAIKLARAGSRVALLTVDPAQRLARVLGVERLSGEFKRVDLPECVGTLSACVLDTKTVFDALVEKHVENQEQKLKIKENPLYKTMVEFFSGSHEYASMEKVLEIYENADFDYVVVDTPPSQNAYDFFSAPDKLIRFFDQDVFRWFEQSQRFYLKWIHQNTKIVFDLFEKVFGKAFWTEFTHFMQDISVLREGFLTRHQKIKEIFSSSVTRFDFVLTAESVRIQELVDFKKHMEERNLKLSTLFLNRLLPKIETPFRAGDESTRLFKAYFSSWQNYQEEMQHKIQDLFPGHPIYPIYLSQVVQDDFQFLIELGERMGI